MQITSKTAQPQRYELLGHLTQAYLLLFLQGFLPYGDHCMEEQTRQLLEMLEAIDKPMVETQRSTWPRPRTKAIRSV